MSPDRCCSVIGRPKTRTLCYFLSLEPIINHSHMLPFLCRLLVGAPLGQNLQPQTNHSGALFKCPITARGDDCEQVITDGRRCKSQAASKAHSGQKKYILDNFDVHHRWTPLYK